MTKSLFIGSTIVHLERVDSSNNYARTLVRDKMPIEGTVIVADEQTEGRGQRSNSWLTEPKKNLTCSYILKPVFLAAKDQFILSAAVALAVSDTVSELLPTNEVQIKWPNDVLVDGKKIAGILIENTLRGMNLENSIVGIGLNVNQVAFPSGLNATSIQLISGQETELNAVLQLLNSYLEKYYLQLREGRFEHILHQLNANLFGIGNERNLTVNGEIETVSVIGVRHTGELELERTNGSRTLHQHHEIGWNL
ncbi:MAG: biotin--[acetyl-CoA-carboxylase] ligase [Flavobacteriales bacterium]|nr:biotin--[acetyl-CoA-carboxylase] ligase [Flavobacteriales bacterium]